MLLTAWCRVLPHTGGRESSSNLVGTHAPPAPQCASTNKFIQLFLTKNRQLSTFWSGSYTQLALTPSPPPGPGRQLHRPTNNSHCVRAKCSSFSFSFKKKHFRRFSTVQIQLQPHERRVTRKTVVERRESTQLKTSLVANYTV